MHSLWSLQETTETLNLISEFSFQWEVVLTCAGQTVALCVRVCGARRGSVALVLRWEQGDLGEPLERWQGGQGPWRHCVSLLRLFLSHVGEVGQLWGAEVRLHLRASAEWARLPWLQGNVSKRNLSEVLQKMKWERKSCCQKSSKWSQRVKFRIIENIINRRITGTKKV